MTETRGPHGPVWTHGFQGHVLALSRAVFGFLFACHGAASLFGVLGGAHGTDGGTEAFGVWPAWWAAVIQLVGGGLVALGAFTRSAATICSGSMAYAYFVVHQPTALFPMDNGGETVALYAWAFALLATMGPGSVHVGRLFHRRSSAGEAVPRS